MVHRRYRLLLLTIFNIFINSARSDHLYANYEKNNVSVIKYCEIYDKAIGICGNLQDCLPIQDLLNTAKINIDGIKQRLTKYFCGDNQEKYSEICCPYMKLDDRFNSKIPNEEHPNINLIPTKTCGPPPNAKYLRGGYADLTDYPWSALLIFEHPSPYLCGGSLINNRYILTSAQCVKNKYKLRGVRLGELDLKSEIDCVNLANKKFCKDPPQDFIVSSEDAIIHADYDENTHQNDIALVRLRSDVKYSYFITPVCLPISQTQPLFDTGLYTVVGWGISDSGASSSLLKYAGVIKENDTHCDNYLKANKLEPHTGRRCTGALKSDRERPCIGDKGGALINSVEDDIVDVQYGVISIKSDCVNSSTLIYTNVVSYMGWILDNIKA